MIVFFCVSFITLGFLFYHRLPLRSSTALLLSVFAAFYFITPYKNPALLFTLSLFCVILFSLNIKPLRRALLSQPLFKAFQQKAPKLSETERTAIEAGTTWFEAALFAGKPKFEPFLSQKQSVLTEAERAFLEGPTEQLCAMVHDWQVIHTDYDLPKEAWQFIKDQGFFGLMIPKAYNGLAFSNLAHSEILGKLASRSLTLASIVAVPNSLGPAELILHYGTEAQKAYYLPRLAKGIEIPCFALTAPEAGSDAAAIPDIGIVTRKIVDGKAEIGISLTWNKRYITLAPVATLLGLAFRLFDPDHLLGEKEDLGITCALIPVHTPGVQIGRRHLPLNTPFQNGPTQGKEVFVSLDCLIGGPEMAGKGWRMLMECLSSGRAISLPASAAGTSKMAAFTTGAYSRLRTQFKQSLSGFDGVVEGLARIAGFNYIIEAARSVTVKAVDAGERPSVLTAILKYHSTELARMIANDSMDIHGGKGIMMGPSNYLGAAWQGGPIAITVEGANILTRCLIIFGQGAVRCHPFVLKELQSLTLPEKEGIALFDNAIFGHIGLILSNFVRTLFFSLTKGKLIRSAYPSPQKKIIQMVTRASSTFALTADITMAIMGSKLKFKESISGRLGDGLSYLYLTSTLLKQFEDAGRPESDIPLLNWSANYLMHQFWFALEQIFDNYPYPLIGKVLKMICMPCGLPIKRPTDKQGKEVALLLTAPTAPRDRLCANIYVGDPEKDPVAILNEALYLAVSAEPASQRLKAALKKITPTLPGRRNEIKAALNAKLITKEDYDLLSQLEKLRERVEAVDDFDPASLGPQARCES